MNMVLQRHRRKLVWLTLLGGMTAASFLVPWTDRAAGEFEARATVHAELRAPVAGFLQRVDYDEGDRIAQGYVIARLAVPDLESRIARKEAELREAEAQLQLLQTGPRDEEITQQQRRVAAVVAWRDVAALNLKAQQQALEQELIRFDKLLAEYRAECDYARQALQRREKLRGTDTISQEQYAATRKAWLVACAKSEQTEAEKRTRAARGTLVAESELAERETELAHEQATLALLQAGTRPEEIAAAQATVERLREEVAYLNGINDRLYIKSPVAGAITTGRLREKVGDYFEEGELVCEVEDASELEVVIALDEDQAARVRPGQRVRLKARSLPFEVFQVQVDRIAPRAAEGEVQSRVAVYCRLDDPQARLRSGMTGYARIDCGQAPIAVVLARNFLRFIRTEFWW